MRYLLGLQEYLHQHYRRSVFDEALASGEPWEFHLHKRRIVKRSIIENMTYDLKVKGDGLNEATIPKTDIKIVYPEKLSGAVLPVLKVDRRVRDLSLEPIIAPGERYHVKNKTLFPLMKERRVLFFTLLEGEVVKGIVAGFSRYEITIHLKGGTPVTILRHSVYDIRDKKGRCFLKASQEKTRDWEKSGLYVELPSET
jgi:hypothetical protein